jgi:acyl-CoA synthetase (AMP-forming)/AMP-acid ligase II
MAFRRPTHDIRASLLQEVVLEVAKSNPDYPFLYTIEGDDPDGAVKTITFQRFLLDVFKVREALQADLPRRKLGSAPRKVGILSRSNYYFIVHWIACMFNGWVVGATNCHIQR